jgi:hypothetical protein
VATVVVAATAKTARLEVGNHVKTKHELERILRGDAEAFFPDTKYFTICHGRDLMSGDGEAGGVMEHLERVMQRKADEDQHHQWTVRIGQEAGLLLRSEKEEKCQAAKACSKQLCSIRR